MIAPEEKYEAIGGLIDAGWSGVCAIDPSHRIKRKDLVTKIQLKDNPILPISGVACKYCTQILKRAED